MKKNLTALCLALCLLLSLAACGGGGTAQESPAPAPVEETPAAEPTSTPLSDASYTYEFEGMMGPETAQFDLTADGTCTFFLPGNTMITDVYAGTYTREGDRVTIVGLTNVDETSSFTTPGLWAWIDSATGDCAITVDDGAGTFVPEGGETASGEDGSLEGLKNVAYATTSPAQVCDIYQPEGVEKAPVIVLSHGGGFAFGDQGMAIIQPVIRAALDHGYAVVSVDYRKSSEALFPAALADVKAAVRFVKANADEYGFDADRIAVWGESAGAYLSVMTALTPNVAALDGDVIDNADVSSKVNALVSFYAPVEFFTMYDEKGTPEEAAASFESQFLGQDISADRDATYATYWETYADQIPAGLKAWIQAGDSDHRVPCTQSENLAQRLAGCIGEENVSFSLIPGADHEDDAFYTDENLNAVFAFLDGALNG